MVSTFTTSAIKWFVVPPLIPIMADHKEERIVASDQPSDDVQTMDATDDFDPFLGEVECIEENIDVALSAPSDDQ